MLLREIVPTAFAVAVPAALDALTALDVPIVATATLIAVVVLGVRLGSVDTRLGSVERDVQSIRSHFDIGEEEANLATVKKAL